MSLHVGDARDLSLLGLAAGSVRCTITSPPYWELKRYAEREDEREIGIGQSKQDYLDSVRGVLEQVHMLSRPDGVLWMVADTLRDRRSTREGLAELMPLPFELAVQAQKAGWRFQDIAIWKKDRTLPYSGQGKLRNLIEYVLFFTRSGEFVHRPYRCAERHLPGARWMAGWPERYHPLGKRPSNLWEFKLETQGMWNHAEGRHACPFPQGLVARCIALSTDKDEIVLDPFGGIGTVVAQAIAMGRRGVGLELNESNVETFHRHVLPEFQSRWEMSASRRRLERADQIAEARLILRLRLLKAGKEMLRAVQAMARSRPTGHPAANVHNVLALQSPQLGEHIDVDAGTFDRAGGRLLLILEGGDAAMLENEAQALLARTAFTSLGLELEVRVTRPTEISQHVDLDRLQEFGLSRHGAFTAPLEQTLFDSLPQLLTDVSLETTLSGEADSELQRARMRGERQLLIAELSSKRPLAQVALRIGVTQAQLQDLLERHGLREKPSSFAVSLPGQLTVQPSERLPLP